MEAREGSSYCLEALADWGDGEEAKAPTPGWKQAGFASEAEAELYKVRQRTQYGSGVRFPWDPAG